jgi:hypothetical protein
MGMAVEDVEKTKNSAIAAGATPPNETLPKDGRFAETFVYDPAGTRVDLSAGWKH